MDNIISINPKRATFHNQLVEAFYGRVFSRIKQHLGEDESKATDITQEVFLEAWLAVEKLQSHPNVGGWLMKTATFKVYHYRRSIRKEVELLEMMKTCGSTAENSFDGTAAFPHLCAADRRLLKLYYIDRWATREIAKTLGISASVVRKRLSRIRAKLKQMLRSDSC
jgi:RNA polymerase sigma-70 factor (ECF subfamily)